MRKRSVWAGVVLAIGFLAFWGTTSIGPAAAQTPGDDGDCDDILNTGGPDPIPGQGAATNGPASCSRAQLNVLTLVHTSQVVREVVAGRLLGQQICGGQQEDRTRTTDDNEREFVCIAQAGLVIDSALGYRQRLAGDGTIAIAPAAAVAAPSPVRKFNSWADAKLSWLEPDSEDATPSDGLVVNLTGGVDYKLSKRIVFGLVGTYEDSDLDTDLGGFFGITTTKAQAFGGGVYAGITLTDHLVFNAMFTGAAVNTDVTDVFGPSDLDSDRIQASAGITGYWYFGQTRVTPSLSIAWSKEWQDEYVDSALFLNPDQSFETGVLSGGNQVGHTFALNNGMSIEPWLGYQLDWTFLNKIETDGFATVDQGQMIDLRIQSGLNWAIAENAQLALTGEIGGLLLRDSDTYAGEVNLAIQF
jgi:hypothetical protein